jgi:uncharacterized membrane protein YfcA
VVFLAAEAGIIAMGSIGLVALGVLSGTVAGLLAGLVGIGGGVVIVPVVYYGLIIAGTAVDHAAHIAVGIHWRRSCRRRWSHRSGIGAPEIPT